MPQVQQPSPYAASPSPAHAIPPAPTTPTHVVVPSSQPLAPLPPTFSTQSWHTSPTPARGVTLLPIFSAMPYRIPTALPEQPSFSQSTPPSPPSRRQPVSAPIGLSEEAPFHRPRVLSPSLTHSTSPSWTIPAYSPNNHNTS